MRKSLCVLSLFAALFVPTLFAGEAGYTLLFNGKDFDGWQPKGKKEPLTGKTEAFANRFRIADGAIVIDYKTKAGAYIETTKAIENDAAIKIEFKAGAGCNNDILIRGTKFDIVPGKGETKNVKEGEWATLEIIFKGDKVEHKINGEKARASNAKEKSGPLVLRAEFGVIEFKAIRVKQ